MLGAVVQSFTVLVLHRAAELLGWELGPLEEGSWKVAGRKPRVGKAAGAVREERIILGDCQGSGGGAGWPSPINGRSGANWLTVPGRDWS